MTIKEFRLSQGLSQPKLAKALGIGVSTVGGYEAGRIQPSQKVIDKIKEVYGVDLAAPAEAATAEEKKTPARRKKAEAAPAEKKTRARKPKAEAAPAEVPVDAQTLALQKQAEEAVTALVSGRKVPTFIIQSPMGGEITPEEVLAKVGDVDKVYVRVDQNAIYWTKGDESGAVNIW